MDQLVVRVKREARDYSWLPCHLFFLQAKDTVTVGVLGNLHRSSKDVYDNPDKTSIKEFLQYDAATNVSMADISPPLHFLLRAS